MTIFYCLKFETPPTCRARSPYLYPPGRGWSSYNPRHWVPFSSPPTTLRATVTSTPPPHGLSCLRSLFCSLGAVPTENTTSQLFLCCLQRRCYLTVEYKRHSIASCVFVAAGMCLPSHCLAMDVCSGSTIPPFTRHVTILIVVYYVIL
jgi:hypothetical protein